MTWYKNENIVACFFALALAACGGDSSSSVDLSEDGGAEQLSSNSQTNQDEGKVSSSSEEHLDDSSSSSQEVESSQSSSSVSSSSVLSYIKDSFIDCRDDNVYNSVQIGEQVWMAENLNYASAGRCYKNDESNCEKYGRLYTAKVAAYACPPGWYLPDTTEWKILFDAVGGLDKAAIELKREDGWNAVMSGYTSRDGTFYGLDSHASFWTSTVSSDVLEYSAGIGTSVGMGKTEKYTLASIRCLKDPSIVLGEMGSFIDERDGHEYKTVKMGSQTWMAENLNYEDLAEYTTNYNRTTLEGRSFCYDLDLDNCEKYGRLYTWSSAMDTLGVFSSNGEGCGYPKTCSPTYPVRGICPEKWHLPDSTEWEQLFKTVGGKETAARVLKSIDGWNESGNGVDAFGFSAIPAGNSIFYDMGYSTSFWSATGTRFTFFYDSDEISLYEGGGSSVVSVRCVKDE